MKLDFEEVQRDNTNQITTKSTWYSRRAVLHSGEVPSTIISVNSQESNESLRSKDEHSIQPDSLDFCKFQSICSNLVSNPVEKNLYF